MPRLGGTDGFDGMEVGSLERLGNALETGRGEYAQPGHGVGILASNYCLRGARDMQACGS